MNKKPIDHIDHFINEYRDKPKFLSIASAIPPSRAHIKQAIKMFEENGLEYSPSGTSIEILAQWCKRCGCNFVIGYEATAKAWLIRKAQTAADFDKRVVQ